MPSYTVTIGPNAVNEVEKYEFSWEFDLLPVSPIPRSEEKAGLEDIKSSILDTIQDVRHSIESCNRTGESASHLSDLDTMFHTEISVEEILYALETVPEELQTMHQILNSAKNGILDRVARKANDSCADIVSYYDRVVGFYKPFYDAQMQAITLFVNLQVNELVTHFKANLDAQRATLRNAVGPHAYDIMTALFRPAKRNTLPLVPVHFYAPEGRHVMLCSPNTTGPPIRYWDNKDVPRMQFGLRACVDLTSKRFNSGRPCPFEMFVMHKDGDRKLKMNFKDPNRPGVFGKPQVSLSYVKKDQSFRIEQLESNSQLIGRKFPVGASAVKVEDKMARLSLASKVPRREFWYPVMSTKDNSQKESYRWWLVPLRK
ncbi:hypothetical protein ACHAPU_006393 [Fusarium lateritium]